MKNDGSISQVAQLTIISTLISTVVASALVFMVFGATNFQDSTSHQAAANQSISQNSQTGSMNSAAEAVAQASPSVVSIIVSEDVPVLERYLERSPYGYLEQRTRQDGTERQQVGGGSGFFVSDDGLIVTNRHVVSSREASYSAVTSDGQMHELEVVDRDPFLDIAILRTVEQLDYPALTFGDSSDLRPGQSVIAIGNALGEFQNSVSVGVVSGLSRSVIAGSGVGQTERLEQVIQTDAAINFGNSGGPLLNLAGEVIGVNVAIAEGSDNISFALPSNAVAEVVEMVEENGEIVRPFLGVRYVTVTPQIAQLREFSTENGALVIEGPNGQGVTPDSSAQAAGIRAGDILVSLGGVEITPEMDLGAVIRNFAVGDTIDITLIRNGQRQTRSVTLQAAPESVR